MLTDTMKLLGILFYSILVFSCNQNPVTKKDNMQKSDTGSYPIELISNDFLKYADSSRIDSLKEQITKSFDIYEDDNFKIAHIDAEELAEFTFDFFLPSLNRILAKREIKLSAQKLNENENSFDALINADTIQLYTKKDLDNNTFWDIAPRNFFRKVNAVLRAKNTIEQFYLLYGGNDLHVILLTEKQFSIITNYYKNETKEIPYTP